MRKPVTHKLRHPIVLETQQAGSNEVTEQELKPAGYCVVVRRAKAKDMQVFDSFQDAPMAGMINLIERLTPLDKIEVDNLDAEDFDFLGDLAVPDKPNGPKNGPTG